MYFGFEDLKFSNLEIKKMKSCINFELKEEKIVLKEI